MRDATSLRQALTQTCNDAKTIQSSASFMMRLYDKSSLLAVSEWRNTLQTCQTSQLLPLLYVANEVLQNSKRNRGNKFLEAFSPVLADSLKFICERDHKLVEKVRRTTKIWGDRRVFSTRFVGVLLKGLESFRDRASSGARTAASIGILRSKNPVKKENPAVSAYRRPSSTQSKSPPSEFDDFRADAGNETDDSDLFQTGKPSLLNVSNISIPPVPDSNNNIRSSSIERRSSLSSNSSLKRRRSSKGDKSSPSLTSKSTSNKRQKKPKKRRSKTLSIDALLQLLEQLLQLESQFQSIELASRTAAKLASSAEDDVAEDSLVGEELSALHTAITNSMRRLRVQERESHRVALQRKELEKELMRYVVWGKALLSADEEEIRLCDEVEKKILLLDVVHSRARKERELKRDKEAKERVRATALARQKEQDEKLKQDLEATLKNTEETRPGMVWNQCAREFQYLPDVTEESWRD